MKQSNVLITWAIVGKETNERLRWFIEQLKANLCTGDGFGWALVSDT